MHAQYCLKQSGIATDAVSCISPLTAEMLAASDDDDDDPFLTSDDNEDELERNELTVEDTDWLHFVTYLLTQAVYWT